MFSNYPLKAIEELATKFEHRIFNAGEVVAKHTQQLSEILIIYHGQASLFRENNPDP
jgi:signal-transduction protein with cAMP-binding, CBS, and nucleotidyltransferase domain